MENQRKLGRPRRAPNEHGELFCRDCNELKPAENFYRRANGTFDSYCKRCRRLRTQHFVPRTNKQARESAWGTWYRRQRVRLELAGHEWPPGMEPDDAEEAQEPDSSVAEEVQQPNDSTEDFDAFELVTPHEEVLTEHEFSPSEVTPDQARRLLNGQVPRLGPPSEADTET